MPEVPGFFRDTIAGEVLVILIIAVASFVVSQIVVFVFNRVLKALTSKTATTLDDLLIEALHRPIFLLVFIFGIYLALTAVAFLDPYQWVINRALLVAELALVVYGVARVAAAVIEWYATEIAPKTESDLDDRLIPIARRAIIGLIYGLGVLMVLRAVGLDISPLLAGLGLGGLAVALALQPTLNNLIAGAFTVSESKIGVGDYIRLEDGQLPEGTVMDVGWRTTKIKTPQNNTVVIPNAKLADSVVTNYGSPTPEFVASVACGVSYESDLEKVRRVATEVGREVLKNTPGGVADSEPVIRFHSFQDSNITFNVLLRTKSYGERFAVVSDFIMQLHKRFGQEGIEMSYPVRKVIYSVAAGGSPPQLAGAPDGQPKS